MGWAAGFVSGWIPLLSIGCVTSNGDLRHRVLARVIRRDFRLVAPGEAVYTFALPIVWACFGNGRLGHFKQGGLGWRSDFRARSV